MSDTRKRADVSSRATAPDAWDAGLHAESEAGPIDVGLSVEPSAVGVIVDAPGIGLLKLAFDLQADGTTRLSRASRRLSDGRDATLVAIDEAKVLQLEGALSRLQKTHDELTGTLTTERDEARDRAEVISEDRKELDAELASVRAKLSSVTADLTTEKEGRLDVLAEREKARAEFAEVVLERDDARARISALEDDAKQEAEAREVAIATARAAQERIFAELEVLRNASGDAGSALSAANTNLAALEAGKARADEQAVEQARQLETATDEQARLADALETATAELGAGSTEQARLTTELEAATAELATLRAASVEQARIAGELEIALAEQARLAAELFAVTTELETLRAGSAEQARLSAELEAATAEQARLTAELELATAARAQLGPELDEVRANLEAELARREESLSMAVARGDALQGQLAAAEARMGAESAATREAREVALKLKAERDEARTLARQLHAKVAAPQKGEGDELRAALDAERQIAANLVSERDQLNLRIEALGRMIDQERDGRARALSEGDEWQQRFKALAKGNVDVSQPLDFSREETRSYILERPTLPETPAARAEAPTDPAIKKKGP